MVYSEYKVVSIRSKATELEDTLNDMLEDSYEFVDMIDSGGFIYVIFGK